MGIEDTKGKDQAQASNMEDDEEFGVVDEKKEVKEFTPSVGLTSAEAEELLRVHGRNELEEKSTPVWLIFLKALVWAPMPAMIWLAIILEFAIQNYIDGAILLGIVFINAGIGTYETAKAANAVAALKASLKPKAHVKRDGKWQTIDAALLVPGDLVTLALGGAVPADCLINEGQIDVDQAALTGESLPVTMYKGNQPLMGSNVVRGETEATVEFTGNGTFFGKTATLLNQEEELGNLQKIILKITFVLVVLSLALCITAFVYMITSKEKEPVREALGFTVVLLVASIPVAIEIVCTTTLALGSRQLSSHGAIVTRLMAIEEMAGMNLLCSDKTGTLTLNKMVIQDDCPIFTPGVTRDDVIQYAALAAKWKEPPKDALDTLTLGAANLPALDVFTQTSYMPFDPTVKRTEGTLKGPDGKIFKTTKGAPHVLLKLCHNKDAISKAVEWKVNELASRGIRSLAVARTQDKSSEDEPDVWSMQGILTFLDPPRPDTKDTIHRALAYGVDTKMITGDHAVIARETARQLGMGTNILGSDGLPSMPADGKIPKDLGKKYGKMILEADGFAQVFPEHKFLIVEAMRQEGFAVGMTGDGVNDAPALKRADVGIAVQGSTDAARAAADIVLTKEGLSVVVEAIVIARQIFQRIKTFISYRIACTLQLLIFFFIAIFALPPIEYGWIDHNFFKVPVLMLMLITLLNDGTLISIGYDNVKPSERPEKWNLRVVFLVSIVLGAVACASSVLLLALALEACEKDEAVEAIAKAILDGKSDGKGILGMEMKGTFTVHSMSHSVNQPGRHWPVHKNELKGFCSKYNEDSTFLKWGLGRIQYSQIITMIYLKVSVSDFLTLFSARTMWFFWERAPGKLLAGAGTLALSLSTILACAWPKVEFEGTTVCGLAMGKQCVAKEDRKFNGYDYTLFPLWVWMFCFFWFVVQDGFKVVTYLIIYKYDLFGADTSKLVNNRQAMAFNDPKYELARTSAGMVEGKLLGMKADDAVAKAEELARTSGQAGNLRRVSASLQLVRNSVGTVRQGIVGGKDVEGGSVSNLVGEISEAASSVPAAQRGQLDGDLRVVNETARKLQEVADVVKRQTRH